MIGDNRMVAIILPTYNDSRYLTVSVPSIIKQTYKDVCLYIIDDGSTDNTNLFCDNISFLFDNVKVIRTENRGASAARNTGVIAALADEAEFIGFIDADDRYVANHIQKCVDTLRKYPKSDFTATRIRFFGKSNRYHPKSKSEHFRQTKEVDADVTDTFVGHLGAGLFRAEVFEVLKFNEKLIYNEDIDFFCQLLPGRKFAITSGVSYRYRVRDQKDSTIDVAHRNPKWYARISEIYKPMFEKEGLSDFIKRAFVYNFSSFFTDFPTQMDYEDYDETIEDLQFILERIEDKYLNKLPFWHKNFALSVKYGTPYLTKYAPIPTFCFSNVGRSDEGYRYAYLGDPLYVHLIDEKAGVLLIRLSMRYLTYEGYFLDVQADFDTNVREVVKPVLRPIDSIDSNLKGIYFCTREVFPRKFYEIEIDINSRNYQNWDDNGYISFYLTTETGKSVGVPLEFLPQSNMGYNMPFTLGTQFIIRCNKQESYGKNHIKVEPFTKRHLYEYIPSVLMPYRGLGEPEKGSVLKFRELSSNILKNFRSFSARRIWLFMDRNTEAGNNAEVLYRHCIAKEDGIEKYFVIPNESYAPKFRGLPYIVYGSLEFLLLCIFAEKFISAWTFQEGITLEANLKREEVEVESKKYKERYEEVQNIRKIIRSFFRGDIIHVQHGVIIGDLSFYINKFEENIQIFLNVSKKEQEYCLGTLSCAFDEKAPRLTGLPKFDGLENIRQNSFSQKIILFAPSFARGLNWKDQYNPEYKNSEHFKYLNGFINDPKLHEILSRYGYILYFKPHYMTYQHIDDFDIPKDNVEIVYDEIERDLLFSVSSMMISDYSGITFEFAYLRKPIIYVQHVENTKYQEDYFSYEKDGFGEVVYEIDILLAAIERHLQGGCIMSTKYLERVERFFTFNDMNNCERAYLEIMSLPDKRKNIFEQ